MSWEPTPLDTGAGVVVVSPHAGRVVHAGPVANGAVAVVIEHFGGAVTAFSHLMTTDVVTDDRVVKGQRIGTSRDTEGAG